MKIEKLFYKWGEWASTTFPKQTSLGKANHLVKEAKEVVESIEKNGKVDVIEIADVLGLIFSICDIEKINLTMVENALSNKLDINKKREWVENEDGSYSHIKK